MPVLHPAFYDSHCRRIRDITYHMAEEGNRPANIVLQDHQLEVRAHIHEKRDKKHQDHGRDNVYLQRDVIGLCYHKASHLTAKVNKMKKAIGFALLVVIAVAIIAVLAVRYLNENKILKEMISRLEADSRIAEVLVTDVKYDEQAQKVNTTIKFLEYDSKGRPMDPKYYKFRGNIIQFESLVVRFDDIFIRTNDKLKGKSAYLFWKVFMLDGPNTMEYNITETEAVPEGYKIDNAESAFEKRLWKKFWDYALNENNASNMGIKNAQIEAPGTMFVPGTLYTIRIEHDGGMRIDASPLPAILKGERIL